MAAALKFKEQDKSISLHYMQGVPLYPNLPYQQQNFCYWLVTPDAHVIQFVKAVFKTIHRSCDNRLTQGRLDQDLQGPFSVEALPSVLAEMINITACETDKIHKTKQKEFCSSSVKFSQQNKWWSKSSSIFNTDRLHRGLQQSWAEKQKH